MAVSTRALISYRYVELKQCNSGSSLGIAFLNFAFSYKIWSKIIMYVTGLQLLLKGASERGAKKIRVHVLTDGRDVLDGTSVTHAETLEKDLSELRGKGIDAQIASGGGRMYVTMDRYEVTCSVNKDSFRPHLLHITRKTSLYCVWHALD